MFTRRLLDARALGRLTTTTTIRQPMQLVQSRPVSISLAQKPSTHLAPDNLQAHLDPDVDHDPGMNGGYVNPPAQKRSLRDPYGPWDDMQERRNFGEPVHEDNDILGVFSTEPYTHFTTGWGAVLLGTWLAGLGVLLGVVYQTYPDKVGAPRTFPGGLERELGGPGALVANKSNE